jgi:hypothetical protein
MIDRPVGFGRGCLGSLVLLNFEGSQDLSRASFIFSRSVSSPKNGKLRVEQSLEQTKAGLRFKPPKSKHGRRSITIPPAVVADLRANWKATQEQRLALGLGRSTASLVSTMWDGAPRKPNALTNDWLRPSMVTGRRINLHALRHTHASSLIAAGVDILTISRRLGHANPKITPSTSMAICTVIPMTKRPQQSRRCSRASGRSKNIRR